MRLSEADYAALQQKTGRERIEQAFGHLAGAIPLTPAKVSTSVSHAKRKEREAATIRLSLPFAPVVNHQYGRKGSQTYLLPIVASFRAEVAARVHSLKIDALRGFLWLSVKLHRPDRRKFDIDGPLKATLDALQHAGLYVDDAQIVELRVSKLDSVKGGRIDIEIREV